jgi:hypothetical protein
MATVGLLAAPAGATSPVTNGTTHPLALGQTFALPPTADLPPSCAALGAGPDTLVWTGGSSVSHDTKNANGDWGGFTTEGPATLYASNGTTVVDQGHATEWGGGGTNSTLTNNKNQGEGGLTLTFTGSTISFHLTFHMTQNNAGTPTASVFDITCS